MPQCIRTPTNTHIHRDAIARILVTATAYTYCCCVVAVKDYTRIFSKVVRVVRMYLRPVCMCTRVCERFCVCARARVFKGIQGARVKNRIACVHGSEFFARDPFVDRGTYLHTHTFTHSHAFTLNTYTHTHTHSPHTFTRNILATHTLTHSARRQHLCAVGFPNIATLYSARVFFLFTDHSNHEVFLLFDLFET